MILALPSIIVLIFNRNILTKMIVSAVLLLAVLADLLDIVSLGVMPDSKLTLWFKVIVTIFLITKIWLENINWFNFFAVVSVVGFLVLRNITDVPLYIIGSIFWVLSCLFLQEVRTLSIIPLLFFLHRKINFWALGTTVDIKNYIFYSSGLDLLNVALLSSVVLWGWLVNFIWERCRDKEFLLFIFPIISLKEVFLSETLISSEQLPLLALASIILLSLKNVAKNKSISFIQLVYVCAFFMGPWMLLVCLVNDLLPVIKSQFSLQKATVFEYLDQNIMLSLITALVALFIVKMNIALEYKVILVILMKLIYFEAVRKRNGGLIC